MKGRCLYKVRISKTNSSYNLIAQPLNVNNQANKAYEYRGSDESFYKFIKRSSTIDINNDIASKRKLTYKEIHRQAVEGEQSYVYMWSNNLPKTMIIHESFLDTNLTAIDYLKESVDVC